MIEFKEYDSYGELLEHCNRSKDKTLIIDCSEYHPTSFYMIKTNQNGEYGYALGNQYPFKPGCVIKNDVVYLGHNDEVDVIKNDQVVNRIKNNCFFEFVEKDSVVIAIFEIGIVALRDGEALWTYHAHGVIEEYSITGDSIAVTVDSKKLQISLLAGIEKVLC